MGSNQDLFTDFLSEHMGRCGKRNDTVIPIVISPVAVYVASMNSHHPAPGTEWDVPTLHVDLMYIDPENPYTDEGPISYLVHINREEVAFLSGITSFSPLIEGPELGTISRYLVNMSKAIGGALLTTDRLPQVIGAAVRDPLLAKMLLINSFLIWRLKNGT